MTALAQDTAIYVVKTMANHERTVANMLAQVAKREYLDIRAILAPDELRGYVFVEADGPDTIEHAIQYVQQARALVKGASSLSEITPFLTPKTTVVGITEGAIVELISGPFKGEKARVKRVDESHEEITVELFEAMVPIPVTVRGDHVRMIDKTGR